MNEQELSYALAKQVPDVERRSYFYTNYGTLQLDEDDSKKIASLVAKLLRKKLDKAVRVRQCDKAT